MWNHSNLQHTRFIFGTHFCIYNKTYSLYVPVLLWRDRNFEIFLSYRIDIFIPLPTPRTFLGFLRQSSSTGGQPCQKMRWTLLPLTKKTKSLSTSASKINKKTKSLSISASRSTKRQNLRQYLRLDQPKDKIFVIIGVKNQQKHKIFVNIGL